MYLLEHARRHTVTDKITAFSTERNDIVTFTTDTTADAHKFKDGVSDIQQLMYIVLKLSQYLKL